MLTIKKLFHKFSTRLFGMAVLAGLVPIILFGILTSYFIDEFSSQIEQNVRVGYQEQSRRSSAVLQPFTEGFVRQKALDAALHVKLYLLAHPEMTLAELHTNDEFRKIAIQPVGKTGYTSLLGADDGLIHLHLDPSVEGIAMASLAIRFPEIHKILQRSQGGHYAYGEYAWPLPTGKVIQKYGYFVPVQLPTADGFTLIIAATVSYAEMQNPILSAQKTFQGTLITLESQIKRELHELRTKGSIVMSGGLLIVVIFAFISGLLLSRVVKQLRMATTQVNRGELTATVKTKAGGELGELVCDFNIMLKQLADTTVKKELLMESEELLREAHNSLLESENRFRALFEQSSLSFSIFNQDGSLIRVNKSWEKLWGRTVDNLNTYNLKKDTQLDKLGLRTKLDALFTGEVESLPAVQYNLFRGDSKEDLPWIKSLAYPIANADGEIENVILVQEDVSKQLRMEDELVKVEKLESVGVLAGGIAHDFNNLLTAILGNINLAMEMLPGDATAQKLLLEAQKASIRANDLTRQLLTFAKGGIPSKETSRLQSFLQDSADFVLHGSKVVSHYQIPDNLWSVEIDKGQISQVIQNLAINASQAMDNNGRLDISCRNVDNSDANALPFMEPRKYIEIIIQDSGNGIPQSIIKNIFDPYFTTKEQGSGLGLAICHSIISKHSGHITVESFPGTGTCFTIYLPTSEKSVTRQEKTLSAKEDSGGVVMIMDDEEMVRSTAGQMLTYLGYTTIEVADGNEALKHYKDSLQSGNPIDAVLMDLTIPGGMGGIETAQKILDLDPQAKLLVSSGYSNDPAMAECTQYGFMGAVPKPFTMDQLSSSISSVLQQCSLI